MNSGQLIANQWIKGEGEAFASYNPATGQVVWQGEAASPTQVHAAVTAARGAFSGWRAFSYAQRLEVLLAFRQQLENNKPAFAQLIAEETGKPLWESLTEVGSMIAKISISDNAYR
jgi:succinylglutamic semialdehyde dehydrogenase